MSVDMLSEIISIKRNLTGIQHNHVSDVFQGTVEDLNKVAEQMEEDLEAEADDGDDEYNIISIFFCKIFHNMFLTRLAFRITLQKR